MEAILIGLMPYIIPIVGGLIVALASWGIAILKSKIKLEQGKVALDQIDQIVGTVVGDLAQTTAKEMRKASADGHLSIDERNELKESAVRQAKFLISNNLIKIANESLGSVNGYIGRKIEDSVGEKK